MCSRPLERNRLISIAPSTYVSTLGNRGVIHVIINNRRRAHELCHVHLAVLAYSHLSDELGGEHRSIGGSFGVGRSYSPRIGVEEVVASEFSRSGVKRAAACAAAHLGHHDVLEPEVVAGAFKIAFLRRHFERTVSLLGKRNSRIAVIIRTEDVITFCANCHHRLELDTRSRNGYIEHYFRLTETLQFEGITLLDEFERHRRCRRIVRGARTRPIVRSGPQTYQVICRIGAHTLHALDAVSGIRSVGSQHAQAQQHGGHETFQKRVEILHHSEC